MEDGGVGIGAFSERVGISVDALRAWERRYGLLQPLRTSGGRRLYTTADAAVVAAMRECLAHGMPAAEAARVVLAGRAAEPAPQSFLTDTIGRELESALDEFSDGRAQTALDRLFGGFGVETVIGQVVLPYLRRLGERWERGEISVAHEHFASTVVLGRLHALARNWDEGAGPRALLACPSGELHSCGLLCFALLARAQGWRVTYLGADSPIDSIRAAAEQVRPEIVVLAAVTAPPFARVATELQRLSEEVRAVWLAGAGASARLASSSGCTYVADDPVAAARALSALRT